MNRTAGPLCSAVIVNFPGCSLRSGGAQDDERVGIHAVGDVKARWSCVRLCTGWRWVDSQPRQAANEANRYQPRHHPYGVGGTVRRRGVDLRAGHLPRMSATISTQPGRVSAGRRVGDPSAVRTPVQVRPIHCAVSGHGAGIGKYRGSGLIKGIGQKTAQRIVANFQLETLEVIDQAPERLLEVLGTGPKRVEIIRHGWQIQKRIRDVMVFLQSHGSARRTRCESTSSMAPRRSRWCGPGRLAPRRRT